MAEEKQAIRVISIFDTEVGSAEVVNFRSMYQNVADLFFPRESNIISLKTAGEELGSGLIDPTGRMANEEMASGFSIILFPSGQRFYNIVMADRRLNDIEIVKRTLGQYTDISHEKRANSNFMLQANNTLLSLSAFGTGNMFSEWLPGTGLNYRDYDVGMYVIFENSKGLIDGVMIEFEFTADQATEEWGDKAGATVIEAMEKDETQQKKFKFIWSVRPRKNRQSFLIDKLNMPFEDLIVNRVDKVVVREDGFNEFPFSVSRWATSSSEKWGRGRGTMGLPVARGLQTIKRDWLECGNKWNNPAREVLESFEGEVRVFPNANNFVAEIPSIRAIDQGVRGNFPFSTETLETERDELRKIMFNDVFVQLRDLKGDRRTTLEIRERLIEGLQRLGTPFGRLQAEWLTPMVTRDIMLLLRNGQLPPLPPEMQGKSFKIEYVGRLALQLKGQQARGWQQWVGIGVELEGVFPALDNVRIDQGYRRLGETLGVSVEDMATQDEIDDKREQRAADIAEQKALELAQVAGQAYGQTTKAPEEGSLAGAVTGV